jgi:hypothetical protein
MSRNLGALTLLDPSGPAWPVMGVLYLFLMEWIMEMQEVLEASGENSGHQWLQESTSEYINKTSL